MPGYAKFMKDLVTKKRSINFETIKVSHQVSAIVHSMTPKLEDPGAFMIPCTIGSAKFAKALCDLGRPLGVIEDVLVRVDKFILPADFVILDADYSWKTFPCYGGRFFVMLKPKNSPSGWVMKKWYSMCESMWKPNSNEVCYFVDLVTDVIVDDTSATINVGDMLEVVLLNFDDDEIDGLHEMGSYNYAPRKLSLDLENRTTPPTKPSIEEPPTLELKPLPPYLRYEFLGLCSTLPVILSSCLTNVQVDSTLAVLHKRKKSIG
ncbi:uncharacterized protein [Nicotiana tomentosiformis]|uniref:uncharacterized protein n=1 Tax=Nicotiana tomentosiformis TaxID=4098 RepID=UPI00388CC655